MTMPPHPHLPRLVQTALLWGAPVPFLEHCHRRHGAVFTAYAAPIGTLVYVTDPEDIRAVFGGDPSIFRAGEPNSVMRGLLGDSSVLLLDGAEHRARRRLMLPPFHRDAVRRQAGQMADIAASHVARWPVDATFPVAPRMAAITLEVILRVVLGSQDEQRLAELRRAIPQVLRPGLRATAAMVFPGLTRLAPWRTLRRHRATFERLVRAEIADRRADPDRARRTDVLAMLVDATDAEGRAMTDDELRDQLVTLLVAGHETTATALSWTLERLVRHPEVLHRAVHAADSDDGTYLDAVVAESLRSRPVVFDVARTLSEPVDLAGYRLPAGVTVMASLGLVQRSAEQHADPERFDPDRPAGVRMPFGGGARRCLGATFAQVEMRVVLREVLRAVTLETTTARAERPRAKFVTLVPHRGARVRIRSRRTAGPRERDAARDARIEV